MADPHHVPNLGNHGDADTHAYVHGEMEINEQVSTWKLVQTLFSWGSLMIAAMLLFLTIWFQPGGSFFGGFIAGVLVFVAGFVFLRSGKSH